MDRRFEPIIWIQEAGYTAYLVGNQVRARLLGQMYDPKDIDVATSATVHEVASALRAHSIMPTNLDDRFGVVAFQLEGHNYEVTTFRQDIYDPSFDHIKRTPAQIIFDQVGVKTDAQRRDFTVNAVYWDPKTGRYIDPVGGEQDLMKKTLRFIGDPEIRIKEDPIRVLRAIRFRWALGLRYDATTRRALQRWGSLVHKLQGPALKKEFQKIQNLANYQQARKEMREFGVISRT